MSIALIITDRDVQALRHSIETELKGATPVWI